MPNDRQELEARRKVGIQSPRQELETRRRAAGIQDSRRGQPQSQTVQGPPQGVAQQFSEGLARFGGQMANELEAAKQGTTSVVRDIQGQLIRPLAPQDDQDLFLETGRLKNEQTQIVLRDPEDSRLKVFMRTPETDEGMASRLGRVVGLGAIAPAQNLRTAAPKVATEATRRVQDFADAGVDTTLGTVTQGAVAKRAESALSGSGLDLGQVGRARERGVRQAGEAAESVATGFGAPTTRRQAGESLRAAGLKFTDKTRAASETLYNRLGAFFKSGEKLDASNSRQALRSPLKQFDNPDLATEFLDPRIARWQDIIERSDGQMTWKDMKQFRTEVGRMISKPDLTPDQNRAQLETLYGALSRDIEAASNLKGQRASDTFALANDFFRDRQDRIKRVFKGILGDDVTDEGAFTLFEQLSKEKGAKASVARLRDLRTSVSPEEWGDAVSMILREMGKPTPGARNIPEGVTFSPASFLTRWSQLGSEAKGVLFSKSIGNAKLRPALDRLVRVTGAQKAANQFENVSRTGLPFGLTAVGLGAFVDPINTALGLVASSTASALMTNPRFVRWYAGAVNQSATPDKFRRAVQTLALTTSGDQDLAPLVAEFVQAVSTGGNGRTRTNARQGPRPR